MWQESHRASGWHHLYFPGHWNVGCGNDLIGEDVEESMKGQAFAEALCNRQMGNTHGNFKKFHVLWLALDWTGPRATRTRSRNSL